jgi:fumarate hydratase class II
LISRSIAFTSAASAALKSFAIAVGARERVAAETVQFADRWLGGERLQPGDLDADARADQSRLAEHLTQLDATGGVTPVERRQGAQGGEGHAARSGDARIRDHTAGSLRRSPQHRGAGTPVRNARPGDRLQERRAMSTNEFRVERDSMGELRVPATALWGAQTQRAIQNFPISGLRMPRGFIRALGLVKWAAAGANLDLHDLDKVRAFAIQKASLEVAEGRHDAHFPVDVFQTGSGTSSNMNANEVIAHLAAQYADGTPVHPNDHVNRSQSSNDVIPTAIHLSAAMAISEQLLPALKELNETIARKSGDVGQVVKTGRTHLMDAMPLTLGQEMGAWRAQIEDGMARLQSTRPRLHCLAQGGTAVGTGINAHPEFGARVAALLSRQSGLDLRVNRDLFSALSAMDTAVELSGQLRTIAVSLTKIANDLRWMNSGPLAGLAEIALPALQPGSSIMPGKVNPVVPEAVAMVAAQVIGNDATVALAGQSGNFQLNVMLPVIAYNLLQSIDLLANAARTLGRSAIAGFAVNTRSIANALERNPVLVTALNPVIGYEKGAAIAKKAWAEGRPVREVAAEMSGLDEQTLSRLLDPTDLTRGGVRQGGGSGEPS